MTVAFFIAAGFLAVHITSVVVVAMRRAVPRDLTVVRGRISLLRPVCGSEPFDMITLSSSFNQDWPDYEILFCAASEQDSAVPLVRRLIDEHPGHSARLLIGNERPTGNPKLDNLVKGWMTATGDWVCMTDSNLLLTENYLTVLAQTWDAQTGLVSCPAWGSQPEGWAGALECAFLNTNQARLQFFADSLGIGFAQGKSLFWNRQILDSVGGPVVLGRDLAEDVASTKLVHRLGLQVKLPAKPFTQPIGKRTFKSVWDRQLRWSRIRRDGFPWLFLAEPLNGPVAPVLLLALGGGPTWLAAFLLIWYWAEVALSRWNGWPATWLDIVMLPLRDLLIYALWLATFLRRGIEWRGHTLPAPRQFGASL
ncbi:glycosyltransferase [Rhizobium sp. DBTS2]|jgi:ceramide glucosyltransferase|uniref:Glycosyltransferase n=2 Tax=Hyphomicrobiales TaxID=356 RepID=A0ABX2QJ34_9HYPH|nr:glycosyltransferase [Rhizobium rhizolycopersici]